MDETHELLEAVSKSRDHYQGLFHEYKAMADGYKEMLKKAQTERDALEERVNVMKAAITIKNRIIERQKNDLKHQIDGKECFQRMCEELLRRLGQKDDMKSLEE
jgi:hypothetical protein